MTLIAGPLDRRVHPRLMSGAASHDVVVCRRVSGQTNVRDGHKPAHEQGQQGPEEILQGLGGDLWLKFDRFSLFVHFSILLVCFFPPSFMFELSKKNLTQLLLVILCKCII
jgi:hypothetical protein